MPAGKRCQGDVGWKAALDKLGKGLFILVTSTDQSGDDTDPCSGTSAHQNLALSFLLLDWLMT